MILFFIILVVVIVVFSILILIIFSYTKKEHTSKKDHEHNTNHNNHDDNHGHDDHGHTPPSKKMGVWGWIWNIVAVGIVIFLCFMVFTCTRNCTREKESSTRTIPDYGSTEALILMAEYDLDENHPSWTTPYIDYKFKIRTEGHAINIQFNGMKNLEPYPPEGNFSMPSSARPGSAIITLGDGEKKVHVQLYKKIKV